MKSRVVCPYCFERLDSAPVAFRCVNPDETKCPHEIDHALAAYQRMTKADSAPKVITRSPGAKKTRQSTVCSCGVRTTKRVCPHCHNDLPGQFGMSKNFMIALVGAKQTGKSHYVAVLVHELTNRVGESFRASINALDERTIRRYHQDFERFIYAKSEVIPGTPSARASADVRYPLVYRFFNERKSGLFGRARVSTLVFFDTAGEDLDHIDSMSTETRYIANADGLVFLLDPLQIPVVRDRLVGHLQLPDEEGSPDQVLFRVADLIRRFRGLGPTQLIDTPVAIALSKVDAVRSIMDPSSPVQHASQHRGFFDLADSDAVDESVRAHLAEWAGTGLQRLAAANFRTVRYFGLSALGSPPDPSGRLVSGVAPFRVEDPILWLLARLGVLDERRRAKR